MAWQLILAKLKCCINLYQIPSLLPAITIDANVNAFKYISSIISQDDSMKKEIDVQINKAGLALGKLSNNVLNQYNICLSMKIKVYEGRNGLLSLLYWCKMRTLYCRHIMKMESFHMQALHVILGITLHDQTTDLEILDHEDSTSIESMLIKAHIWWTGHVLCMEEHCILKHLYRELLCGRRHQGQSKLIFTDGRPDQTNLVLLTNHISITLSTKVL